MIAKIKFEFDHIKSDLNKEKHEIDFIEAQKLWQFAILRFPSKKKGELRELVIGKIESTYWTAIITQRDNAIRIISCRRARDEEKTLYTKKLNNF